MNAAGVDIGKRRFTIAAVPFGEKRPVPAVVTVETTLTDPMAAAAFLAKRLAFYLENEPFMHVRSVWLEEPWGKFQASGRDVAIVLGFLAAQFDQEEISVATVSPDTWRKTLGLPTRGGRPALKIAAAMYARAAVRLPDEDGDVVVRRVDDDIRTSAGPWSEDESDAICMALACRLEQENVAHAAMAR